MIDYTKSIDTNSETVTDKKDSKFKLLIKNVGSILVIIGFMSLVIIIKHKKIIELIDFYKENKTIFFIVSGMTIYMLYNRFFSKKR